MIALEPLKSLKMLICLDTLRDLSKSRIFKASCAAVQAKVKQYVHLSGKLDISLFICYRFFRASCNHVT